MALSFTRVRLRIKLWSVCVRNGTEVKDFKMFNTFVPLMFLNDRTPKIGKKRKQFDDFHNNFLTTTTT